MRRPYKVLHIWLAMAIAAGSLLMACSSDAPTATRAQSPSGNETVASAGNARSEVQQLFESWAVAFQTRDAGLLHSTLNQELSGLCRVEDMQPWIEALAPMPELGVAALFVDVDNPDRAFAELSVGSDVYVTGDEYYHQFMLPGSRYPVEREAEGWRVGNPISPRRLEFCPFAAIEDLHLDSTEFEEAQDLSDVLGVDVSSWEVGSTQLFDGTGRSSSSQGIYAIDGEKRIATDQTPGSILQHYRDGLAHPNWNIKEENFDGPVAWVIWTVRDAKGNLWMGSMVAVLAGQRRVQVWMSMFSDDLR